MSHSILLKSSKLLLIAFISCQSCMSTRVISQYDNDSVVKHSKTNWSYAWGLIIPKDIDPNCDSKQMTSVTSTTNLGYIFLSTITLGIVVPQTLEWECAPIDIPIEDL